jgi:iron complex outermembrane receptor protein
MRNAGMGFVLSLAVLWFLTPHAIAQTSVPSGADAKAPDDDAIADIIVTAQRRSESSQKAALTVEVTDPQALSAAGVTSPSLLTSALPTVQIATAGPATAVYVRGVGGFAANSLTSPAVPYYFDGVYVGRTQSVDSELYDVERLELVKGPQGTLYGRNASGGAVNVITRDPVLGSLEARGQFEVGDYNNKNGEAAVNIPLGTTAAILVSGTVVDKGGYTSIGLGDDVHQAVRVKVLWSPSDDVSLRFNTSYGHIGGLGSANVTLNRNIPGWYPWLDASDPRSQAFLQETASVPVPGFVQPSNRSEARQNLDFFNVSAPFDWSFGSTTLTVIPAYRHAQMQYAILLGFVYQDGYGIGTIPPKPETSNAKSLETRLSGENGPFKWVAGLYYYDENQSQDLSIDYGYLTNGLYNLNPTTVSYAGFGQASLAITDHIRLIGGLRDTADSRGLDGNDYLVSPIAFNGPPPPAGAACAFPVPTQPQCLVDSYSGRHTYHNVSWKGGFEADVFGDSLYYATASRGFKAGGFSQQSTLGAPGQAQPFKPETLTSYETGLKSRFLNERLQLNLSGFYWDYKDHQEPVVTYSNVPGIVNQIYLNAGTSTIFGGNLDLIGRPWSGGTINAAVEYAHSKYENFAYTTPTFAYSPTSYGCPVSSQNPGLTTLNCAGYQVSRTPEWSGTVGIDQTINVGRGELDANINVNFASARWLGTDFIASERAAAYGKLDTSLTYRGAGDRWSVSAFVRNITNAAIYTDASKNAFSSLVYADIQPPRSYGTRVTFKY